VKSKEEVAKLFKKQLKQSQRALDGQYQNTKKCQAFYNNDIGYYRDQIEFAEKDGAKRRAMVNFGKIQENIDSVSGFLAQNRRQAKFTARVSEDQGQEQYSKNMNAYYTFHRDNQNADQLETDQDTDMLINGYGGIDTDLSYMVGRSTTTPNGEILKKKLRADQVYWDGRARAKNLLDSRYMGYHDDYDLKDALNLFQKSKKEDFEPVPTDDNQKGYTYNPWGGLYDRIKVLDSVEWASQEEETVRVYNHQWMEYETFYKAENPIYLAEDPLDALYMKAKLDVIFSEIKDEGPENIVISDMFDFDPTAQTIFFDQATKGRLVAEFGDLITPIPFTRKCFYTAVVSGDHVFSAFKSISQQGFSIKFKTGYYDETHNIWVGMTNAMMEPAEYFNKALTEMLFALAANSKGGVIIEEDAVEDIVEFTENYAKTDGVCVVRSGTVQNNKIMPKAQPAVPTGLETILTLADQNISANGVPSAFMGNVEREDQSGIFFKRRIRQIISKLSKYFDSVTLYQKEDARLHLDLIPVWVQNNEGASVMIAGPDGGEDFIDVAEDMLYAEYAVSVQESPQTPEDKQETATVLGTYADRVMPFNPSAGQAFLAESLQMLPLPGDVRARLVKTLQPSDMVPMAEMQKLQAQLQEVTSQLNQAQMAKLAADTALSQAKTITEQANAADKLEQAANKGLENDLIRQGGYEKATVSI